MNNNQVLGYRPGQSAIHRLNAVTKLAFFLLVSIACMTTYDTRFLAAVGVLSVACFVAAGIRWRQVSFIIKFILAFSVLNLVAVFIFQPSYGAELYGTQHVLFGSGYFTVTSEELFYLLNLALKYVCTVPLAVLFLLTTNPSYFASSLNRLGISYRVSYAVALALRYIPDIQDSFWNIRNAQQARGIELSKKAKFGQRVKGSVAIVLPLVLTSLERINTISTAMQLRRFGSKKRRTWYRQEKMQAADWGALLLAIALFGLALALFKVNDGRFYNPFK